MIPVLTRAQMRAFDARAIEVARVPSLVLMENAGRGAAEHILRLAQSTSRPGSIVIVCGTGNNGGDGFVVARQLWARMPSAPAVYLCGKPEKFSEDARANHDAWVGLGGAVHVLADIASMAAFREALQGASIVVDAIFGTGLDRPTAGVAAEVIALMNDALPAHAARVALDIPSGVDADTGAPLGVTFRADLTLTFAHPKLVLLTPRGLAHAGRVEVVDLGIPTTVPDQVGRAAELIEREDVARWLSRRGPDAHKYSAGHVAVLAGSAGKIGASLLVAQGAMRAGAGAATIVTWPEAMGALQARVLEVMTASIDRAAIPASLDAALKTKRAVVIGPGFGLDADAAAALEHVLANWAGPAVIDADAITLLSRLPDGPSRIARGVGRRILTPHTGELARLLGLTSHQVEADRFAAVTEAAGRTGAVVILKGAHSLIADPRGRVVVNVQGTPALATAGSGDVLAGIIGAQAASLGAFEAACAGVYLHAEAGVAAAAGADRGMLASQIADGVVSIVRELQLGRNAPERLVPPGPHALSALTHAAASGPRKYPE